MLYTLDSINFSHTKLIKNNKFSAYTNTTAHGMRDNPPRANVSPGKNPLALNSWRNTVEPTRGAKDSQVPSKENILPEI